VLALERTAEALLAWSRWRRWHQAWARSYHYRRREGGVLGPQNEQADIQSIAAADVVWSRLEPLLLPAHRIGRPYDYPRRRVLNAIVYVMQTDCGWRHLPAHFPPWPTVYAQLRRWRETGIWDKVWVGLEPVQPSG
jgi:Putative transposase of IS4/5 family (DUF4096)